MPPVPPDPPVTVSECLEADHRRLDALMEEVARLAGASSFEEARSRFTEFRTGLDLHIQVEEGVLFPAFERETGMTHGPTHVMRIEHEEIRQTMGEADQALCGPDAAAFDRARARLESVLGDHNMKEEQVLYPMCDRALPADEVRQVVERIQADR